MKVDPIVVYLDDEINLLEIFTVFMEDLPVKVETYSDPEECIATLNSSQKNIVCGFFDYRLRGTTGVEVISKIKNRFPSYIISGDFTIGDIQLSDIKGVLSKPIDFEKVRSIAAEYLKR
jgi:DNA-binding NtrC family response regulator